MGSKFYSITVSCVCFLFSYSYFWHDNDNDDDDIRNASYIQTSCVVFSREIEKKTPPFTLIRCKTTWMMIIEAHVCTHRTRDEREARRTWKISYWFSRIFGMLCCFEFLTFFVCFAFRVKRYTAQNNFFLLMMRMFCLYYTYIKQGRKRWVMSKLWAT